MKFIHLLSSLIRNQVCSNRYLSGIIFKRTTRTLKPVGNKTSPSSTDMTRLGKFVHTNNDDELYEDLPIPETETEHTEYTRNIIFKNSEDDIIKGLNSCVSIEEVLNVVEKYVNVFEDKHAVQTILVLRHLQKIFNQYNDFSNKSDVFLESIKRDERFKTLLGCINSKVDDFNPDYLSYILLYLNKLGFPLEDSLIQTLVLKVQQHLLNDFDIAHCSRFLTTVFYESPSIRPYYFALPLIPLTVGHIEQCKSVHELYCLTICLNKLHKLVTHEVLKKYSTKVKEFLKMKMLTGTDYPTILKIIQFLNYPEWRDKSVLLTSECIMLLKDEMSVLKVEDLTILYEVFFKNQEPGDVLDNIQRRAAQFLNREDDVETSGIAKLRLFSSLIYFSSPIHRLQFRKHVGKYLNDYHDFSSLVLLRKVFSYVKVSDPKLCAQYWDMSLNILNEHPDINTVLKLCRNYIHFNTDVNNYRCYKFEYRILHYIKKFLQTDIFLNPEKISSYLCFVMLYGRDKDLLELLLHKFEQHSNRLKESDCLKISHSLFLLKNKRIKRTSPEQIKHVNALLRERTKYLLLQVDNSDFIGWSTLLKAAVLRGDYDSELVEDLLIKFKELDYMSSKLVESISYLLSNTRSLIPEIINKCTEYVINHKSNILGFNAEKLLYSCYTLAYHPVNGDKFFEDVIDVILRDQERLSGLSFLQSALSLCYFNKLPSSFIKQIFNVEFMEKLDSELENCYSKDRYPQRVRKILMALNRAVCLEYPEYNVPWFHQKYIEDMQKISVKNTDKMYHHRINEYLAQVLQNPQSISKDVVTPYGYHIDFVVNFNSRGDPVSSESSDINRRVAVLLFYPYDFTQFYTHLKGKYQMKMRHLEIFGYEVAAVNFSQWINLLYPEERLEFISKLIWPETNTNTSVLPKR